MVVIDKFSKYGWTVNLKSKNAKLLKNSFVNFVISSNRRPNSIETDDGSELLNNLLTDLLDNKNIKHYSKSSNLGAVFVERFNRKISNLPTKVVFLKGVDKGIDVLSTITKQYNLVEDCFRLLYCFVIKASSKENDGHVFQNLTDKRKRIEPNVKIHNLVSSTDFGENICKNDTNNWSYNLCEVTENAH